MDTVFDLQMFADDDDDTDAPVTTGDVLDDDSQTATGEPEKTQKLLTEREAAKIMAREHNKGKKQAVREIEKEFGCDRDEAKAILASARQIQELLNIPLSQVHEFLRQKMQPPLQQPPVDQQQYPPPRREPQRDPEEDADHEFLRKQRTEEKPLSELRQQIGDDVFNELLPKAEELASEEDMPVVAALRYLLPKEMSKIVAKQRASAEAGAFEKFKDGRIYAVESGGGAAANMEREEVLEEKEEKARKRAGLTRKEWVERRKLIAYAKSQDGGKGAPNIEMWRTLKKQNKR